MKRHAPFFIAIASLFSVGLMAQNSDLAMAYSRSDVESMISHSDRVVVSYYVEERINMPFGGRVTTYNVSDINLVSTNNLGEGNTRRIIPKYGKAKIKSAAVEIKTADVAINYEKPAAVVNFTPVQFPEKIEAASAKNEKVYAYINFTDTYERILSKGYKSVDMLKRVANSRFFDGNLEAAAKWYAVLFEQTTDLDEAYFYHYAQALTSLHQTDKAAKIMEMFANRKK